MLVLQNFNEPIFEAVADIKVVLLHLLVNVYCLNHGLLVSFDSLLLYLSVWLVLGGQVFEEC